MTLISIYSIILYHFHLLMAHLFNKMYFSKYISKNTFSVSVAYSSEIPSKGAEVAVSLSSRLRLWEAATTASWSGQHLL